MIAKAQKVQVGDSKKDDPGCGSMMVVVPGQEKEVPLPLKHTEVSGKVVGYIASVAVSQQFENPYDTKIEASYVFPLSQNSAVNEFIMTVGDRKIRGIIREREEAERIYAEAKRQGYRAALMTQERPNIFTQKVANIEPGKSIDINIKYFNTLTYRDGWYEFAFPMVVGPRYNPPGSTDGVGAVAHGKDGSSGQKTEVQYLKPNQRSGHDIGLTVAIDAGVAIEELVCNSHVTETEKVKPEKVVVKLSKRDSIPNKDFVLRYKVAGDKMKSGLVTHTDERGGYFTMMLYPPASLNSLKKAPMELIFVLDCSGSMNGKPMELSKKAMKRALRKLSQGDTFQVIRFSSKASKLGRNPVLATAKNIRRGLAFVDKLRGDGGTQMIEGIKAALDFKHDPKRTRVISFMTDGYIGNESQILAAIHDKLGSARIFSFGVGSSPNYYLLDRMAWMGNGAVARIGLDDSTADAVDGFYDAISHPALTDIQIDWGGMEVSEVYPGRMRDLIVGRPVILTGRYKGTPGAVKVNGRAGQYDQRYTVPLSSDSIGEHKGIACVWARMKIADMNNQLTYDKTGEIPGMIKDVALEYGLMSAYTAFLAVDSSQKTTGDHGISVAVPVPVPDGIRYDTTVQ